MTELTGVASPSTNVYTDVSDAKTLLKRLGKQLGE
jgi:hypothetical protein